MSSEEDIALREQSGRAYSVTGGVHITSQVHSEPSPSVQGGHRTAAQAHGGTGRRAAAPEDDGVSGCRHQHVGIVPYIVALSGMTVVTNDFGVVNALADATHVDVIHTGGLLDHPNRSCVGGLAEAAAESIRALGVDAMLASVER
ncbi:DeoR C terminal sensor domain-containing protein [Pseudomonas sp. LP_7_YM]|nr:DeoR C terminal sensor domain-containing protein [Pseudomonas sp. LP_7_YM]